ncbi:hypothetical protein ACFCW7_22940 [Paenibacillus glucanolyticus]|uniref:hypothetical protein n=1 Tax=Paenibacillus glucanolyticus TaxID=59843 RepID=UPI0035D8F230
MIALRLVPVKVAKLAAFLFYRNKFLSRAEDENETSTYPNGSFEWGIVETKVN